MQTPDAASVSRLAEHLAYCPHSTPEDERAGLAVREMQSRLEAIVTAVQEVAAFEQAGGDDWWGAHDKLYRAAGIEVDRG